MTQDAQQLRATQPSRPYRDKCVRLQNTLSDIPNLRQDFVTENFKRIHNLVLRQ